MKFKPFFEKIEKKVIYLIIFLIIVIYIVLSEYAFNLSNNENISTDYQNISLNLSSSTNNITPETNRPFLIGESYNVYFSWLNPISSVGTFIAALIALFTLLELKKQRQLSDTPKVLFFSRGNKFDIFWKKIEDLDFTLPVDWKGDNINEPMSKNNVLPAFQIPLEVINAGSSPALKMKVKWKMDYIDDLINSFNKIWPNVGYVIDKDATIPSHKILIGGRLYQFPTSSVTPTQEIEYILPYSNIENKEKIFLPYMFPTLISLALTDFSLTKDSNVVRFPHLFGLVEYLDLSSTIHKSEFNIELHPILTKKITSADYEEGFKSATISIEVKMKNREKISFNKKIKNFFLRFST